MFTFTLIDIVLGLGLIFIATQLDKLLESTHESLEALLNVDKAQQKVIEGLQLKIKGESENNE